MVLATAGLAACPPPALEPGQTSVHLSLYTSDANVRFVLYQEEDGPWKPLRFNGAGAGVVISSERYGFAFGCKQSHAGAGDHSLVRVLYSTVSEAETLSDDSCGGAALPKILSGTVTGLLPGEIAQIRTFSSPGAEVSGNGSFSMQWLAFHSVYAIASMPPSPTPTRVIKISDFDPKAPLIIDFHEAVAPMSFPLKLPQGVTEAEVFTYAEDMRLVGTKTQYYAFPKSVVSSGAALVTAKVTDGPFQTRSGTHLTELGPTEIALPAKWSMKPPVVSQGGRRLFDVELPAPSEWPFGELDVSVSTSEGDDTVTHSIKVSNGWQEGVPRALSFPDFSSQRGYTTSLELFPAVEAVWRATRTESNADHDRIGLRTWQATDGGTIP